MPVLSGYFNVDEAGASLRLHPETVKRFCREGKLRAEKVGNQWLIPSANLESFAEGYSEPRGRPPVAKKGRKSTKSEVR